jgi:hypothetical protein
MPIFADSDLAMCEVFKVKTLLSKVGSQRIFDSQKRLLAGESKRRKIGPHLVHPADFPKLSANPVNGAF